MRTALPALAQCEPSPDGATYVVLVNTASFPVIFYVDGQGYGMVPPGDRQAAEVSAGEHLLRAENGEDTSIAVERAVDVPAGYICPWTIEEK
jgi:hypothetical protein